MKDIIDSELHLDFKKFKESEILKVFLSAAFLHKLPFASWKLPGQSKIHLIMDLSGTPQKADEAIEDLNKGFLFSPFLKSSKEDNLFLKADIYYNTGSNTPELLINNQETPAKEKAINMLQMIENNLKNGLSNPPEYFINENFPDISTNKEEYVNLVKKAIDAIDKGEFEKVVVSRNKRVALKEDFDIVHSYLSLCKKYANAFVSLISVPDLGTWIGATPETLIKTDAQKFFFTESLAGTQPLRDNNPIADVTWTQKEIEEQALVSRYIINCFKKIRLREFEEIGPKTIVAGNLLHLRTLYKVDMETTGFPNLGSVMLALLHPTSAVCGMPKEPAMDFILEHEKYDRNYYSGYLGPVNFEGETQLFVNLRCMQLFKDHVILYAGAGILGNSDPEKEWKETELKSETLIQGMEL